MTIYQGLIFWHQYLCNWAYRAANLNQPFYFSAGDPNNNHFAEERKFRSKIKNKLADRQTRKEIHANIYQRGNKKGNGRRERTSRRMNPQTVASTNF